LEQKKSLSFHLFFGYNLQETTHSHIKGNPSLLYLSVSLCLTLCFYGDNLMHLYILVIVVFSGKFTFFLETQNCLPSLTPRRNHDGQFWNKIICKTVCGI